MVKVNGGHFDFDYCRGRAKNGFSVSAYPNCVKTIDYLLVLKNSVRLLTEGLF
jgi:hypothetical protein